VDFQSRILIYCKHWNSCNSCITVFFCILHKRNINTSVVVKDLRLKDEDK